MRSEDHILGRTSDEMLGRARACKVGHRTVEMMIGAEQAHAGTTRSMRGLFP